MLLAKWDLSKRLEALCHLVVEEPQDVDGYLEIIAADLRESQQVHAKLTGSEQIPGIPADEIIVQIQTLKPLLRTFYTQCRKCKAAVFKAKFKPTDEEVKSVDPLVLG